MADAALNPEELSKVFNMPAGDMMEKLGLLTADQVKESGRKQAYMVALRDAIKAGSVKADDPRVPQFKGAPDLLGLAGKSETDLAQLMKDFGIPTTAVDQAQQLIDSRGGVNAPDEKIKVPFIGMIHNKLYGSPALSQASLIIQQAIRASETGIRLQTGITDPGAHDKKREFAFKNDKDDPRLKAAVALHEKLSLLEKATPTGTKVDVTEDFRALKQSFADAATLFSDAGKSQVVAKILEVTSYYDRKFHAASAAPETPKVEPLQTETQHSDEKTKALAGIAGDLTESVATDYNAADAPNKKKAMAAFAGAVDGTKYKFFRNRWFIAAASGMAGLMTSFLINSGHVKSKSEAEIAREACETEKTNMVSAFNVVKTNLTGQITTLSNQLATAKAQIPSSDNTVYLQTDPRTGEQIAVFPSAYMNARTPADINQVLKSLGDHARAGQLSTMSSYYTDPALNNGKIDFVPASLLQNTRTRRAVIEAMEFTRQHAFTNAATGRYGYRLAKQDDKVVVMGDPGADLGGDIVNLKEFVIPPP